MTVPSPPTPAAPPADRPRHRHVWARRAVIAVFIALVAALIAQAAWVIHRDTLATPAGGAADATCSAGLRRVHAAFDGVFARRRAGEAVPLPPSLDRDLAALRPACEAEGDAAREAHAALVRWRYRAEDRTRTWAETLHEDAARALHYHSPGTPR